MKKTTSGILAAAVSGLLLGSTTSCGSSETAPDTNAPASSQPEGGAAAAVEIEKHACASRNSCKGKGGCKTEHNECKGMNSCEGKGGCATVAHHSCKGNNSCKELGGCGSGDNGCKAKNTCKGNGGCAVPIKH